MSGLAGLVIPPNGSGEAPREREQIAFGGFRFVDTSRESALKF
jgi:hypothetical protein